MVLLGLTESVLQRRIPECWRGHGVTNNSRRRKPHNSLPVLINHLSRLLGGYFYCWVSWRRVENIYGCHIRQRWRDAALKWQRLVRVCAISCFNQNPIINTLCINQPYSSLQKYNVGRRDEFAIKKKKENLKWIQNCFNFRLILKFAVWFALID